MRFQMKRYVYWGKKASLLLSSFGGPKVRGSKRKKLPV
jgi:hypothetical protein